jgi:Na+/proline symporter
MALARLIRTVATVVAGIIVAAIILRLVGADSTNTIVHAVNSAASFLAGPFKGLFKIHNPKTSMAVNWGLAAVVYFVVGHAIARVVARGSLRGMRRTQPVA